MLMQKYLILQTSEYTKNLLSAFTRGTIHSVYRKTINLQFDGQLLALQSSTSPLSPISLITSLTDEEIDALNLSAGMSVSVIPPCSHTLRQNTDRNACSCETGSCCIQLGDSFIFSLETASVYDLNLVSVSSEINLQNLEELCLETLCLRNTGSFELLFSAPEKVLDIPFLQVASLRIKTAKEALLQKNWDLAADTLCHLIGLGLGLTPGGDDFLCGVLAGLILIQPELSLTNNIEKICPCTNSVQPFRDNLTRKIRQHLSDTNDISAAFLHCALNRQFALSVNRLTKFTSAKEMLSAFSEIGHSSGTDTLCGIYFILNNRRIWV